MSDKIKEGIIIQEGIDIEIEGPTINVRGKKGELTKRLIHPKIKIQKQGKNIMISSDKPTKREKTMIGTFKSHINNMVVGVTDGYVYTLKICSGHFPMTVNLEGNVVTIKNFLGEKVPRKAKIPEDVNVKIQGDQISVESLDKEKAGLAAARIEQATKVKGRDRRVFQDGIYIISKAGKSIK